MKSGWSVPLMVASSVILAAWVFVAGGMFFLSLASQRSPSDAFIGFLVLPFLITAAGIWVCRPLRKKEEARVVSVTGHRAASALKDSGVG
jgi:hypothetical protein